MLGVAQPTVTSSRSFASAVRGQNAYSVILEPVEYDKNSDKRLGRNDLQKLTKSFYQAIDKDSKNFAVKKTVPAKNEKIIFELGSESDAEEAISAFNKKVEVTKYKAVQVKKKMPRIIVYDVTECEDADSFRTEFLRSNDNVKDMVDHGELLKVVTMLWKDRSRATVKIDKNCIIQAYADDICMIISSESIGQLEEIAQKVFTKFEEWSAKNKLEFDKNKTEAVLFTNKHKVPKINLKFGGDIIESQGDTGVKLQYTHSRLCSLKKNSGIASIPPSSAINFSSLIEEEAINLVRHLLRFEEIILRCHDELEPCILVAYLFQLCNFVSVALRALQVKSQPANVAEARLLLFICAKNVLAEGMRILGLTPLEEM
ncbi:hypothetical protein QYM36_007075 [Artemia franciscana]|uniref:Probable arginine--tRNA ligase, mitochondrial n=1 Tax=Artemia franciscana TaxID=6661 RepID=A0AA88I258_ARTSF|nr:hypothetical protein QYM36_007075 [Artemia franciscana]